jgi:hypothetical protein
MTQQHEDPQRSAGADLVDALTAGRVFERRFAAERYGQIDGLRRWYADVHGASWSAPDDLAWRDLRAEVAASLTVHERTAESLLGYARRLVHEFSTTLSWLSSARISDRHARIVVDHSSGVPTELLGVYEERVLAKAESLPPSRFEKHAAMVAASIDPSTMVERHREAMTDRRVYAEAAAHGMAWVHMLFDAPDALGAVAAITGHARTLHGAEGETRTLAQIEADVARDLLVDSIGVAASTDGGAPVPSPAAQRGVKAEVFAHVPVLTAMGASDEPGTLGGYGPIDAQTARELAGTASSWIRLLTDPADGAILDFGRNTYRVPSELRRYLQVRDEVCRFVGCTRAAKYCDLDHTKPWVEDGETIASNLANFCRGHHRVKGRGRWKVENLGGGIIRCTSPTGKVYESPPAAVMSPRSGVRFTDVDEESGPPGEARPSTVREILKRKFRLDERPAADDSVAAEPSTEGWWSEDAD